MIIIIGLVDYDLQTSTSTSLLVPNIEIMKLATYYRVEENTFCRLIELEETELNSYDTIYFFSENVRPPQIPEAFRRVSNVVYGGTAFTNNYVPFDNSLIDFTIPRTTIYKEFLKQKYQDGIKSKVIEHVLDDSYYRNYAGNQKLPLSPIHPNKRLFLYDKEFFYPDWDYTIKQLAEKRPSSIIRIHPIVCKKISDFFCMRQLPKLARTNEVILELNIPLNEVDYMLKKYKNLFLAEVAASSNVYLSLGNTFKTNFQYYKDYIYKLNLLYAFWSRGIPIKIKYIYPQIGTTNPLVNLSLLTETWSNGKTNLTKTLNDRMTIKDKKRVPIPREERDLLLKFHPAAKDLFNQTSTEILNRGYWRL